MKNSFFVLEILNEENIGYWEVQEGRQRKILKNGVITKEELSDLVGAKEVFVFFSPPLVSSVKIDIPKIKEKFLLKHLLLYKDKYFPMPSGKPFVKYFQLRNGGYIVFAVDGKLWEEIKGLFPSPKRVIGPLYWAFIPYISKTERIYRRDYKGLTEIISFSKNIISIFKRIPKAKMQLFLTNKDFLRNTIKIEALIHLLKMKNVDKKRILPLCFQKIAIKERNTVLYLTLLLIVIIFSLFVGKTLREERLLKFEIAKIDSMIVKIRKEAREVEREKERIEKLKRFIEAYNKIVTLDSEPLELFKALSESLQGNVQIEYIELHGSIIKDIEGKTKNVTELLLRLQKDKRFSELRLKGPVTREENMDRFAIEGGFSPYETKKE